MKQELTVLIAAEINFGEEETTQTEGVVAVKPKKSLDAWLEKVAPVLRDGDFTLGVLEGPLCQPLPDVGRKSWGAMLRMPPEAADALKRAGFDSVILANNHTMDFGAEGMLQTLANLDRVGISYSGGGKDIHEARKPAILERDGVKLAVLSYSSIFVPGLFPAGENKAGIATITVDTSYQIPITLAYNPGLIPRIINTPRETDFQQMREDVRLARTLADIVLVNLHWGVPNRVNANASGIPVKNVPFYTLAYQEEMGRATIDAGADMVIGHHPLRLQGVEVYQGKLIFYSLSPLIFSHGWRNDVHQEESVIVKGYIDPASKRLKSVNLIPAIHPRDTHETYILPIGQAGRVLTDLQEKSEKYGTRFRIDGDEIVIQGT
ncbi:CapA family protein [Chloroflexota bacterium]